MGILITIFSTLLGVMIGSFLNALIYRIPKDINIALPRSACPSCGHTISWYHNIPLLSFAFLRGKCAYCGTKISWQYPIVELATGLFAFILAPTDLNPFSLFNFIFFLAIFSAFLVHFIIDLKHQILPDSINIYLGILFFCFSLITKHWSHWLIGAAVGFAFPLAVSWIFYKLRGQIGLGGGDIKLYAVLGIYLGPIAILQNIFLSCFLGAVVGLLLMLFKIIKKENPIAFGPFILIVASLQIFFENWFNQLMRYIA